MKKHLHKGIALLCSAAIAAGMLVGCSSGSSSAAAPGSSSSASASVSNSESGPLFSEPVTLSMLTPSHASWPFQEDWYVVDLIKEYTNVDLKVTAVDTSGFSEKLNLTMASGELPDLMFLTDNTTVQQYAPQGAFINILDHLDKMPNFKAWYEENQQYAANYLSADGGLYQFPQQGVEETERRGWLYRADIFEELGLEMPTNKDEFYDVLVKLKEAYPDSYPLAFRSFAGTMAQMNMIAPSWGTYYLDITDNRYFGYDYDAQEWTFGPTSPEFNEDVGNQFAYSAKVLLGFVVSSQTKHLDEALAYIDWMYSDEGRELLTWGRPGDLYTEDAAGNRTWKEFSTAAEMKQATGFEVFGFYQRYDFNGELSTFSPECRSATEEARKYDLPQQPVLAFNDEEQSIVNTVGTNVKTFVDEQVSKFLLGERSFDEWDSYVAEVEALGLADLKAVHESSYARVLALQEG